MDFVCVTNFITVFSCFFTMPRLFLGNLGHDCRQRDIERIFRGYGELRNINIKGQYGFIEIDDKDDAGDAIRDINGKSFNGGSIHRLRVEYANAYVGNDRGGDRGGNRGGGGREGRWRRTNYRLVVENLSSKTSWQDLKDYMKKAGDITYTTVDGGSGEGVVEFADRDGMDYALRKMDNTKLDGRRIHLKEERKRSGSRSGSRKRERSRSERSRSGNERDGEGSRSRNGRDGGSVRGRNERDGERSRSRNGREGERSRSRNGRDGRGESAKSDESSKRQDRQNTQKSRRSSSESD